MAFAKVRPGARPSMTISQRRASTLVRSRPKLSNPPAIPLSARRRSSMALRGPPTLRQRIVLTVAIISFLIFAAAVGFLTYGFLIKKDGVSLFSSGGGVPEEHLPKFAPSGHVDGPVSAVFLGPPGSAGPSPSFRANRPAAVPVVTVAKLDPSYKFTVAKLDKSIKYPKRTAYTCKV